VVDASITMIITSCFFHGTAHDHPKISVRNGISSFLSSMAIRRAFLQRCFSSAFRPSGTGTKSHWLSLDDRARVVVYFDIARSKNYIYLIVDIVDMTGDLLTFFTGRSTGSDFSLHLLRAEHKIVYYILRKL